MTSIQAELKVIGTSWRPKVIISSEKVRGSGSKVWTPVSSDSHEPPYHSIHHNNS